MVGENNPFFFFFFLPEQSEGYRNSVPMVKVRPAYSQDKAPLQALGCQTDNGLFSFSKIHVTGETEPQGLQLILAAQCRKVCF